MQESRATSPEEQKVNYARVLNNGDTLRVENEMLRNNEGSSKSNCKMHMFASKN